MNQPRFLIWNIHERAWRGVVSATYTPHIKNANRYELKDALEAIEYSNFRSGNVPNEAMVPEPKETL